MCKDFKSCVRETSTILPGPLPVPQACVTEHATVSTPNTTPGVSGPCPASQGRANPPEASAAVDNKALSNTSLSPATLTIEPEVFKATICKIVFHDGHEGGHLTEQQHFVVGGPEFGKNSIEQLEFP